MKTGLVILVLVSIDQGVKALILRRFGCLMDVCTPIINGIGFHPLFNEDFNWINSRWQLGMSSRVANGGILVGVIFMALLWIHCQYDIHVGKSYKAHWLKYIILMMSGAICRICDMVFYGYCLDYIEIYLPIIGTVVCDMKDIYLSIGCIGFVAMVIIEDIKYKPKTMEGIKRLPDAIRYFINKTFKSVRGRKYNEE